MLSAGIDIIEENQVINCGYGMYFENAAPTVTGHSISRCFETGIFLNGSEGIYPNNANKLCGNGLTHSSGGFLSVEGVKHKLKKLRVQKPLIINILNHSIP